MQNKVTTYALTFFAAILIPCYWHSYGFSNFLWISDIGLFLTVIALWNDSRLLMSMAAVGILFFEIAWAINFFMQLIFSIHLSSLTDYMASPMLPLYLRLISLFHLITPVIWLSYLKKYGYDTRAWAYMTLLYWIIIALTWLCTQPEKNINWVFITTCPFVATFWPLVMGVAFPVLIFLPLHLLYSKCFKTKK